MDISPFVEQIVGYELRGQPPGFHAGLPSRHLTVVISLDEPVDMVAMPDPAQAPAALAALVGGLHAAPVKIRHDGTQVGMQLQVTPAGARALFGMPASALAWCVVPLEDVFAGSKALCEELRRATSWAVRCSLVEQAVGAAITANHRRRHGPDAHDPRPEVARALDRLIATNGEMTVAALAEDVGWSRRHLSACFTQELGIAPKLFGRVLRFQRARRYVVDPAISLGEAAALAGYADQAHMTHEWREFSGSAPGAWLAAELPDVQDTAVDAVA
ncbi:MAG: AraC family transcriptional regulator [Ilumatobacteraceae bacterium]